MEYKHSLLLYKIYNDNFYAKDWLSLHFQQTFNARESNVKLIDTSRLKIGKNIMINRLRVVNGKICYDWLNLSFDTYKFKCKKLFLWYRSFNFIWMSCFCFILFYPLLNPFNIMIVIVQYYSVFFKFTYVKMWSTK